MPPAEEAGGVDVGVRLVLIVRYLDVVPHAVVHHLASEAQLTGALKTVSAAADVQTRPWGPGPAPSASARTLRPSYPDVITLVTAAAALVTELVLKGPAHVFWPLGAPAKTSPHRAWSLR